MTVPAREAIIGVHLAFAISTPSWSAPQRQPNGDVMRPRVGQIQRLLVAGAAAATGFAGAAGTSFVSGTRWSVAAPTSSRALEIQPTVPFAVRTLTHSPCRAMSVRVVLLASWPNDAKA